MKLRSSKKTQPPLNPNFSRVFSEEDEIELLKAFKRSIRLNPDLTFSSFSFREFAQAQISSKLKRLKAKYHLMAKNKSMIKTPQHRKLYSISRKIWGPKNDGKAKLNLEKYPFLVESIPEELKRIGPLFWEGLKSLGEEKCKELNDKWMVLSIQNAEIETQKSILLQKQFIEVAQATRNRGM